MEIEIFHPLESAISTVTVEQISTNIFRILENDFFDKRLTFGTEFRTLTNEQKRHEIAEITKESEFITRKFQLTTQFKESEYQVLGDEIERMGGFWQVDFGILAIVNFPKGYQSNFDEIIRTFGFENNEIFE